MAQNQPKVKAGELLRKARSDINGQPGPQQLLYLRDAIKGLQAMKYIIEIEKADELQA